MGSEANPPRPLTWRLLRDAPRSGARNMAVDHALALHLQPGEGVVRLYGWDRPTVSFGRNEPAQGLYTPEAATQAGVALVRRPTGGRAVLHWREVTYAVVAPLDAWGGLRKAYVAINRSLASALGALGVRAEVAAGRSASLDAGPCFGTPAAGEIVVAGRKLVGSAQARIGGALLQHGSILLEDDQSMLDRLRRAGEGAEPTGTVPPADGVAPATLRQAVGDVGIDAVTEAVAMSLRDGVGGRWAEGAYRPTELEAAERWEEERYARDSWTWRR